LALNKSKELNLKVRMGLTDILLLKQSLQSSLTLTKSKELNLKVRWGLTENSLTEAKIAELLDLLTKDNDFSISG
jgi:hypothetical protein